MSWILDTDSCIYALKGNAGVLGELLSKAPSQVHVSVITESELLVGAAKSSSPAKTLRKLERFLRPLQILPFVSDDAHVYARIRASLERAGTPIGPLDTLIGAHAVSRRLSLVTNNAREFTRIEGLDLENWFTV